MTRTRSRYRTAAVFDGIGVALILTLTGLIGYLTLAVSL